MLGHGIPLGSVIKKTFLSQLKMISSPYSVLHAESPVGAPFKLEK